MEEKLITTCPVCKLEWEGDGGSQGICISKYGRCIVCLARDNPLKEAPWEEVSAYLDTFYCKRCHKRNTICTCNEEINL